MKIRNSFVSNSSSSSFICKTDYTTGFYAKMMLEHLADFYTDEDPYREVSFINDIIEAIAWLEDNPDCNGPLMFNWTINYETFIWTDGEKVFIATCNNNRFYEIMFEYETNYPVNVIYKDGDEGIRVPKEKLFLDLGTMKATTKQKYYKENYDIDTSTWER